MPILTALADMTDSELIEECEKVASSLTHHYAAEGAAYALEASERENMRMRWRAVASECLRRGLSPKFATM